MARTKRNFGCVQVDTDRNSTNIVLERTFPGNRFDPRFRQTVITAVDHFTVINTFERVGTSFGTFVGQFTSANQVALVRKRRLLLEAMKGDVSDQCFPFQLNDDLIQDC